MAKSKSLSWNDRLALIDHYSPSDDQACSVFGVSQNELDTARNMRAAGAITSTPSIDVESYGNLFASMNSGVGVGEQQPSAAKKSTVTSTSKTKTTTAEKPTTATKKVKEPKKRGRKGEKIANAFAAIPTTPTPVEDFATNHGVSVAVLRQSKRFDKSPEKGDVRVKKDKESKTLMIWRETSNS